MLFHVSSLAMPYIKHAALVRCRISAGPLSSRRPSANIYFSKCSASIISWISCASASLVECHRRWSCQRLISQLLPKGKLTRAESVSMWAGRCDVMINCRNWSVDTDNTQTPPTISYHNTPIPSHIGTFQ